MSDPNKYILVPQPSKGKNLSSARAFGNLVYILGEDIQVTDYNINDIKDNLRERFNTIQPQSSDYLLPIGDPVLIGLIVELLTSEYSVQNLNYLKWDRQSNSYMVIEGEPNVI